MSIESLRLLPRPLAFVLPGGGALGAYQVGVLRALTEHEVTADLLVGVSAGSLNAAFVAWSAGLDRLAALEQVWRSVRRRDLLRVHPGRLALAFTGRRESFLDSRRGAEWVRRTLGERQIEDAPTRLAVVATDVTTGRAVALTQGDVVSAVLGSAAFPGVYPPVWRDGRWLMDGGVVADVPLDLTVRSGRPARSCCPCRRSPRGRRGCGPSICSSVPRRSVSKPMAGRCSPGHRQV